MKSDRRLSCWGGVGPSIPRLFILLFLVVAVEIGCTSPFGHRMKEHFMLAHNYTNLNHGSYGSAPKVVIQERRRFEDECEARPDPFFRGGYAVHLQSSRAALASYIGANENDIVFVENASGGVNAILRSLRVQAGDIIIQLSSAYGMVKNTLSYLSGFEGIRVVTVCVVFPGQGRPPTGTMNQTLLGAIENTLLMYPNAKLLSISHITSVPAVILPVEEVAKLCKKYGVRTLVDGAHALGQIPVDIGSLSAAGVDYWIGNGHKWLYSPKGSAILWTKPDSQGSVIPNVISSEFGQTYLDHFEYTGTRDYTAFCSMKAALDFRKQLGEQQIMDWNTDLAHWAETYLANLWQTETLVPPEMTAMLTQARLPAGITTIAQMKWLGGHLLSDYGIYASLFNLVNPETGQVTFWVRLSAQIYLEQADFKAFGDAVLELIPKIPTSLIDK